MRTVGIVLPCGKYFFYVDAFTEHGFEEVAFPFYSVERIGDGEAGHFQSFFYFFPVEGHADGGAWFGSYGVRGCQGCFRPVL